MLNVCWALCPTADTMTNKKFGKRSKEKKNP